MSTGAETLDPDDWEALRALSHRIVDDAIDYTRDIRQRPVWQAMPQSARKTFTTSLPQDPTALSEVYDMLRSDMTPYPMGNIHPRFWMWYMGASNFTGALGDFLAAILGSNLGGGDHAATLIDRQVVGWMKEIVGYPATAGGTLVSGGSMANMIGLIVARNAMAGSDVRAGGVTDLPTALRFYGSDQVHSCHRTAMETLGLGDQALRRIPTGADCTLDLPALRAAITEDRAAGLRPACVIANAGTVNTGAIDDLQALAALSREEGIWFHVDGCIGGLLAVSPDARALVAGIERADSIAIDPHKWLHAPFEVGCALVRDGELHRKAFQTSAEYLEERDRGVAAAQWLHDYGLQTSRGFRALKVWMSLQEHGVKKFGRLIDQDIAHARHLVDLIAAQPSLELVAARVINIVCFRYNPGGRSEAELKAINTEIMLRMQETGVAAVSDTVVQGRHCLRAAINNHRTRKSDIARLVAETLEVAARIERETAQGAAT